MDGKHINDYLDGHPSDMFHEVREWRHLFPDESFREIETNKNLKVVLHKHHTWNRDVFIFPSIKKSSRYDPYVSVAISNTPKRLDDTWEEAYFSCNCGKNKCVHMAAAMLAWEKEHGPWIVWENEYNYRIRKEKEAIQKEVERRREQAKKIGTEPVPAIQAFAQREKPSGPVLFDLNKALEPYETTRYAIYRMDELTGSSRYSDYFEVNTSREGVKTIRFRQFFEDKTEAELVWGTLTQTELFLHRNWGAKTGRYGISLSEDEDVRIDGEPLDEYELACISNLWNAADEASREQVTDIKALRFFSRIRKVREESSKREIHTLEVKADKKENVELLPRIVIENGEPTLSFKIGNAGSRKYILKNCYNLLDAMDKERVMLLGKKDSIDFAKQDIAEKSRHLLTYIQRHRAEPFAGVYQLDLRGSRMDSFYDCHEGGVCELVDKTNKIKDELIPVGHMDINFTLTADRLADSQGTFMGIAVSGFVPVLISGSSGRYVLNRDGLSRISTSEKKVLEPFLEVADAAGYFRFQVGTEKLQEFYYRIIPGLLENPFVEFIDNAEEESAGYLPPEPEFRFYLDVIDKMVTLRCMVSYDNKEYELTGEEDYASIIDYRDEDQEKRVVSAILQWFIHYSKRFNAFTRLEDDDFIYDFLTAGMASLEFFGEVSGSSAFRSRRVVSAPKLQLGISVDDGEWLMDLSLTSKGFTPEELLAVYESYSLRKRYYRLKSGDYVDLTEDNQLGDIDAFLSEFDLTTPDVIGSKKSLPLYRALYLNSKLEERDALISSRDRTFRALIRSYKTVSESEYEVPSALGDMLREYQTYGYKWLRTLEATGFGGILADEMGLGKTVQMISLFENSREAGEMKAPSLVVCPASLVYNWQEEISRFAPELPCTVIAGTAGARKKIIQQMTPGVYITSYDLLKRDIQQYDAVRLDTCVLDEAQYIKNAGAAASKSVKLISAKHRYALTGTPIENRLAELWSIFDFLMPGFLYNRREFEQRFEKPITKEHDQKAAARLREMTGPFILRRRKKDVLKDLPDKLEEVRYARISGEQQRLYDAQVLRMKGMLLPGSASGEDKIQVFAELTKIRQICCDPSLLFEDYSGESAKREACMDLVRSAIEGGHRMLIFSQFVTMLELLEDDLRKEGIEYYKIVGATSKEKRTSMVRAFNEGDVPVFLVSLKAGGTGLNLTGADVVIHYDPWWNLAAQNQATDRAHRIGQERQVTVYKLILKDTIEERIMKLQDAKSDLAESILGGDRKSLFTMSSEELLELLADR